MYEMLDVMIDQNLPKQLPSSLLHHFTGGTALTNHDHELALVWR